MWGRVPNAFPSVHVTCHNLGNCKVQIFLILIIFCILSIYNWNVSTCQSFITVHVMRQLIVLIGLQTNHVEITWLVEQMKRLPSSHNAYWRSPALALDQPAKFLDYHTLNPHDTCLIAYDKQPLYLDPSYHLEPCLHHRLPMNNILMHNDASLDPHPDYDTPAQFSTNTLRRLNLSRSWHPVPVWQHYHNNPCPAFDQRLNPFRSWHPVPVWRRLTLIICPLPVNPQQTVPVWWLLPR